MPLTPMLQKKELSRASLAMRLDPLEVAEAAGHVLVIAAPAPLPVKAASIAGLVNFVRRLF